MDKVWVNAMVRNERLAVPCLLSTLPHVDKMFILDTGSDDGTYGKLQELQRCYPNKIILEQQKLPNCHGWSNIDGVRVDPGIPREALEKVGSLRQYMQDKSDAEWILIHDGDEFHPLQCINRWKKILDDDVYGKDCVWMPFVDFIGNLNKVRDLHGMCRLFRKKNTEVRGIFTEEMHHNLQNGECYDKNTSKTFSFEPNNMFERVWHFESILKPWRKKKQVIANVCGFELPSVIQENWVDFEEAFNE